MSSQGGSSDIAGRLAPPPVSALIALVLVLAAALMLREAASLLLPLLFGVFLALIAWPMVPALRRRGAPAAVALALTILAVLAIVLAVAAIIAISVGELVVLVPRYQERLTELVASARSTLAQLGVATDSGALLSIVSPDQVGGLVRSVASAISRGGLAVLVLALTMIYALTAAGSLRVRAEAVLGPDHALLAGVERFGADLRRYLVVRAELGLFGAVLSLVLLFVLGVPLPGLWAFLVFAASFVPNVGFVLALIPPALLALLDGGLAAAIAVVVGYTIVNFLQDNVLQPVIMATELNVSPLVVFVAVIVWAWILGPAAALLAVPLTVGLVAILEAFPTTRGLASLMRDRVDEPAGLVERQGTGAGVRPARGADESTGA